MKNLYIDIILNMKILETFAGVGSQRMALEHKYVGASISNDSSISEWYTDAIIAYWKIHHNSKILKQNPSIEEMAKQFNSLTLSKDSKKPFVFTEREIKNNLTYYIELFNANLVCNNHGSIANSSKWTFDKKFDDLELLTYSFPCQDLSTAGNMRGLSRGSGTRSSMLWNVIDILKGIKSNDLMMPKILLMENVAVITSDRYRDALKDFSDELKEEFGYESFGVHINASDFNLPQNRKRYFYISVRKDLIDNSIDAFKAQFEEHLKTAKEIDGFPAQKTIRKIVTDFDSLPDTYHKDKYEGQLQGMFDANLITSYSKVTNADCAYPTFNQAKVVVGLDYGFTPTVTFQGEFSRIRVFDIVDGFVKVKQLNSEVNWKLMGFSEKDHKKIRSFFSDKVISSLSGNSITLNQLLVIFRYLNEVVWNE